MKLFKKTGVKIRNYEVKLVETLGMYFNAHAFIKKHNYKKYLLYTGFTFLLLFNITIQGLYDLLAYVQEPVIHYVLPFLQKFINLHADDILKGIKVTFWLIKTSIEVNKDAIFSFVFLILGTPFFSYISSKTEELSTGKTYPFKWSIFLKEIRRGLSLSIRNSFKQFGLILVITSLGFVPVMNIFTPLLTFVVQSYYNGILMSDYTLERHGYSVKESVVFYKTHKPQIFGIGIGFMFLLLIPVIGCFLAPVYALVASYLLFSKELLR